MDRETSERFYDYLATVLAGEAPLNVSLDCFREMKIHNRSAVIVASMEFYSKATVGSYTLTMPLTQRQLMEFTDTIEMYVPHDLWKYCPYTPPKAPTFVSAPPPAINAWTKAPLILSDEEVAFVTNTVTKVPSVAPPLPQRVKTPRMRGFVKKIRHAIIVIPTVIEESCEELIPTKIPVVPVKVRRTRVRKIHVRKQSHPEYVERHVPVYPVLKTQTGICNFKRKQVYLCPDFVSKYHEVDFITLADLTYLNKVKSSELLDKPCINAVSELEHATDCLPENFVSYCKENLSGNHLQGYVNDLISKIASTLGSGSITDSKMEQLKDIVKNISIEHKVVTEPKDHSSIVPTAIMSSMVIILIILFSEDYCTASKYIAIYIAGLSVNFVGNVLSSFNSSISAFFSAKDVVVNQDTSLIHNDAADNVLQGDTDYSSLVGPLSTIIAGTCTALVTKNASVMSKVVSCGNVSRNIVNITNSGKLVTEAVDYSIKTLQEAHGICPKDAVSLELFDEDFQDWFSMCHQNLTDVIWLSDLNGNLDKRTAVKECETKLNEYRQFLFDSHRMNKEMADMLRVCEKIIVNAKKMLLSTEYSPTRTEPVVVWLKGQPGIGKSTMLDTLALDLMNSCLSKEEKIQLRMASMKGSELDISLLKNNLMFRKSPGSPYWEGYREQPIVILDDFGVLNDKAGPEAATECTEFMQMVGSADLPLNMADLSKKGNIKFCSKIILVTTNLEDHCLSDGIINKDAVLRRRDIIVSPKIVPKYAMTKNQIEVVNFAKVVKENLQEFEHLQFEIDNGTYNYATLVTRITATFRSKQNVSSSVSDALSSRANKYFSKLQGKSTIFSKFLVPTTSDSINKRLLGASANFDCKFALYHLNYPASLSKDFTDEKFFMIVRLFSYEQLGISAVRTGLKKIFPTLTSKQLEEISFKTGEPTACSVYKATIKESCHYSVSMFSNLWNSIMFSIKNSGILQVILGLSVVGAISYVVYFLVNQWKNSKLQTVGSGSAIRSHPARQFAILHESHLQTDNVLEDLLQARIRKNFVVLRIDTQMSSKTIRGLMVNNDILLMPRHFIDTMTEPDGLLCGDNVHMGFKVRLSDCKIIEIGSKYGFNDCVGVILPEGKVSGFVSLTKYFVPFKDIPNTHERLFKGVLARLTSDNVPILHIESTPITVMNVSADQGFPFKSHKDLIAHKGFTYRIGTKNGDCGSPLFIDEIGGETQRIIGFHIASLANGYAFAHIVCKEFIDSLMLHVTKKKNKDVMEGTPLLQGPKVEVHDKKYYQQQKTKFRHSVLAADLPTSNVKPAHLTKFEHNNNVIDPYEVALDKVIDKYPVFDDAILKEATDIVKIKFVGKFDKNPRKLTVDEAINGIEGIYDSIPMQKSAGLPFIELGKGTKKLVWFNEIGGRKIMNEPLSKFYSQLTEGMNAKEILNLKWYDCLKDELRPVDKVNEGRTRRFSVCPLHLLIMIREYFGDMCIFARKNRIENGLLEGINPHSYEWKLLFTKFSHDGKEAVCGDFGNFDESIAPPLFNAFFQISNHYYGNENAYARFWCLRQLMNREHFYSNISFKTKGGNPSGNPITTLFNSVVNQILISYVHLKCKMSIKDILSLGIYVYGDDNILIYKDQTFDLVTLQSAFKDVGFKWTAQDKTKTPTYCSFDQIEILQRTFVVRNGYCFAPLKESSLEEIPKWEHMSENGTMFERLESYIMECLHYESYETKLRNLMKICYLRGVDMPWSLESMYYINPFPLVELQGTDGQIRVQDVFANKFKLLRVDDDFETASKLASYKTVTTEMRVFDLSNTLSTQCEFQVFHSGFVIKLNNGQKREVTLTEKGVTYVSLASYKPHAIFSVRLNQDLLLGHFRRMKSVTFNCLHFCLQLLVETKHRKNETAIKFLNDAIVAINHIMPPVLKNSYMKNTIDVPVPVFDTLEESSEYDIFCDNMARTLELMPKEVVRYDNVLQGLEEDALGEQVPAEVTEESVGMMAYTSMNTLRNTGNPQNMITILQREQPLWSTVWTKSQAFNQELAAISFPDIFLKKQQFISKISFNTFMRADLELTMRANTNQFQQGALIMAWVPQESLTPSRFAGVDIQSMTGNLHAMYYACGSKEVTLKIPFVSKQECINLALMNENDKMGVLHVGVINQLQTGPQSTDSADVTIFGRMTNLEVRIPTPATKFMTAIPTVEMNSTIYPKLQVDEQDIVAKTGIISNVASGVSSVASLFRNIPILSSIGGFVQTTADAVATVSRSMGLSKPTNSQITIPMIPRPFTSVSNVNGMDMSNKLGMDPKNSVTIAPVLFGSAVDELNINYVVKTPDLMGHVKWKTSDKTGTILLQLPVTPLISVSTKYSIGMPGNLSFKTINKYRISHMGHVAMAFEYWKGSIQFRFQFIATAFHSGRVILQYTPYGNTPSTYSDVFQSINKNIVNLDHGSCFSTEITIPFVSQTPYKRVPINLGDNSTYNMDDSTGILSLVVLNALTCPDTTTASEVNINWWVCGGEDMQFSMPTMKRIIKYGYVDDSLNKTWSNYYKYKPLLLILRWCELGDTFLYNWNLQGLSTHLSFLNKMCDNYYSPISVLASKMLFTTHLEWKQERRSCVMLRNEVHDIMCYYRFHKLHEGVNFMTNKLLVDAAELEGLDDINFRTRSGVQLGNNALTLANMNPSNNLDKHIFVMGESTHSIRDILKISCQRFYQVLPRIKNSRIVRDVKVFDIRLDAQQFSSNDNHELDTYLDHFLRLYRFIRGSIRMKLYGSDDDYVMTAEVRTSLEEVSNFWNLATDPVTDGAPWCMAHMKLNPTMEFEIPFYSHFLANIIGDDTDLRRVHLEARGFNADDKSTGIALYESIGDDFSAGWLMHVPLYIEKHLFYSETSWALIQWLSSVYVQEQDWSKDSKYATGYPGKMFLKKSITVPYRGLDNVYTFDPSYNTDCYKLNTFYFGKYPVGTVTTPKIWKFKWQGPDLGKHGPIAAIWSSGGWTNTTAGTIRYKFGSIHGTLYAVTWDAEYVYVGPVEKIPSTTATDWFQIEETYNGYESFKNVFSILEDKRASIGKLTIFTEVE